MRTLIRLVLACLALLALVRAVIFMGYAAYQVLMPLEAYHLEAKMVHLAWRAQEGRVLYPSWQSYPHVSNFFGPLYFMTVGWLGRWLDVNLDGLFTIGRLLTIGSGLAAAVVVGVAASHREGRGAGLFAGLLALGAAPMVGFGTMVRPDVMADLLGFAGFLMVVGRPSRWRTLMGAALLVAAIFSKQTTALYLAAAVLALGLMGRRGEAVRLAVGAVMVSVAIVTGVTVTVEPNFVRDLLGESATPLSVSGWLDNLTRLLTLGREVPSLVAVGFGFWTIRTVRDLPMALPSVAILAGVSIALLVLPDRDVPFLTAVVELLRMGEWLEAIDGVLGPLSPLLMVAVWAAIDERKGRDVPMAVLAAVLLIGSVLAAFKLGSDLNYFLGLRLVAAMGGAAVWGATVRLIRERDRARYGPRRLGLVLIGGIALGSTLRPGLVHDYLQFDVARWKVRSLQSTGQGTLRVVRQAMRRAEDPSSAILTDHGLIALYQKERAPFVDPWLFRVLVMTDRIEPTAMLRRVNRSEYDLIVTTHDLFDEREPYDLYTFGLPPVVAEAARRNYAPLGQGAGLFFYGPIEERE